jgi:hypothetical protein
MSRLDAFLFEKLDVYDRLCQAFKTADERFWTQLGRTLHVLVKEIVGGTCRDTFEAVEFGKHDRSGRAFFDEWKLDLDKGGGLLNEWEVYPSFWFPENTNNMNTLALVGIQDSCEVWAAIWAQPLSRYLNDLVWPRAQWENRVNAVLKPKGWLPYGDRGTSPKAEWGTYFPIRLNHLDIARGIESGDLREALAPLEKAITDFASVRLGIDELVQESRAKKVRSLVR